MLATGHGKADFPFNILDGSRAPHGFRTEANEGQNVDDHC